MRTDVGTTNLVDEFVEDVCWRGMVGGKNEESFTFLSFGSNKEGRTLTM